MYAIVEVHADYEGGFFLQSVKTSKLDLQLPGVQAFAEAGLGSTAVEGCALSSY